MRTKRKSIMKAWTMRLGLRHQGVLLGAMRGCDTAPKEAPSKTLTRFLRGVVLDPFCGDLARSQSYMSEPSDDHEWQTTIAGFMAEKDALPTHYVMHLIHAIEIVGYYHPDRHVAIKWAALYLRLCKKLHLSPETKADLHRRLTLDEEAFGLEQRNP